MGCYSKNAGGREGYRTRAEGSGCLPIEGGAEKSGMISGPKGVRLDREGGGGKNKATTYWL